MPYNPQNTYNAVFALESGFYEVRIGLFGTIFFNNSDLMGLP